MSPPIEPVNFLSPKRARLSLKHRTGRIPSKPKFEVDTVENRDEKMIIDREQDENISPNCNIPETMSSPYINDNIVNKNYKVSALGLPNCGNTCFINSIVQVLRYTPNFVDILHSLVVSQTLLTQVNIASLYHFPYQTSFGLCMFKIFVLLLKFRIAVNSLF